MPAPNQVFFGSSNSQISHTSSTALDEESVTIHDEDSYRKITGEMYKQNMELSIRNKTLSILRTLSDITMASLDVKNVAQKIVDTVTTELNFAAAFISLVNEEQKTVHPIAISQTDEVKKSINLMGKSIDEIIISINQGDNLVISAITTKERQITSNLLDILIPFIDQKTADQIENITKIKIIIIYPLIFGGRSVGALALGLGKKVDDLSRAEKETLEEMINLIAIALDRAQLHENLKLANSKLQDLDKLKDEFVSMASHELRTPMTAIKGSLSTILDGYAGEINMSVKEFLTAAYNENDRLLRLVNNLLNISRMEAGRFTYTVVKLDMTLLIEEVVKNLQPAAKERNIYLKYTKEGTLPQVAGDTDKVKEVLINLVGNATKFTHQGGITVKAWQEGGMVITSVSDTGSGIAKNDLERLFKKFSQVGGNYARPAGGTGLGLYISKQIVEGLKGTIWLDSEIGKGTTFYFSLPVAK